MRTLQALDIFKENIDEIVDALSSNLKCDMQAQKKENAELLEMMDTPVEVAVAKDFGEYVMKHKFEDRAKKLRQIVMYRKGMNEPPRAGAITDIMIDRAKEFPIEELYDGKLHRTSTSYTGKCPFHVEKVGSFHIVRSDNHYHCYSGGCPFPHGDAIDFYKHTRNVSFKQAVLNLVNKRI